MDTLRLGEIIAPDRTDVLRDAVHVAVIPLTAVREMRPGEHLANGVVDPFLAENVKPGERFWLLLTPGTVTSLRHVWTHPAYDAEPSPAPKRRSEADVWAETQEGR